jgi:hypothetical protein
MTACRKTEEARDGEGSVFVLPFLGSLFESIQKNVYTRDLFDA